MEWLVTKPCSPALPSSVVMHTLPYLANSSSSSRSVAVRAPKEEHGLGTLILQQLAEVEQRSHTYATAHQQIALARSRWHGETIAKRQHTVEHIALLELGQLTGSVADNSHKKPQLILLTVYKVDGDRTAKHRGRRMVYTYFHKLSWQDFGGALSSVNLINTCLSLNGSTRNHLKV